VESKVLSRLHSYQGSKIGDDPATTTTFIYLNKHSEFSQFVQVSRILASKQKKKLVKLP